MKIATLCLFSLAPAATIYPGSEKASVTSPASTPGIVFIVEGVGGFDATGKNLIEALRGAGVHHQVERFIWSHGKGRFLADLQDIDHVRSKGEEFARRLVRERTARPDRPIFVLARSGGSGIVLHGMECLPEKTIDRVIFLSAAVSPKYDLRQALRATKKEIVSFHSPIDQLVLNLGTRQFGTIDRQYSASAGLRGFQLPSGLDDEGKQLYARLVQVPWQPRMILDGNTGIHKGTSLRSFLAKDVAPWLK